MLPDSGCTCETGITCLDCSFYSICSQQPAVQPNAVDFSSTLPLQRTLRSWGLDQALQSHILQQCTSLSEISQSSDRVQVNLAEMCDLPVGMFSNTQDVFLSRPQSAASSGHQFQHNHQSGMHSSASSMHRQDSHNESSSEAQFAQALAGYTQSLTTLTHTSSIIFSPSGITYHASAAFCTAITPLSPGALLYSIIDLASVLAILGLASKGGGTGKCSIVVPGTARRDLYAMTLSVKKERSVLLIAQFIPI